jgi:hypothetical protein
MQAGFQQMMKTTEKIRIDTKILGHNDLWKEDKSLKDLEILKPIIFSERG